MNFFGKPVPKEDPADQAKRWKREITRQSRRLDRDISSIERAEKKAMSECKKYAKKGETKAARSLAKEIVNTRKAKERIRLSQVQMNSAAGSLQQSISMMKVQGCMKKSTEVMKAINHIINIPELKSEMTALAREMEKAGMIDEIIEENFEMMEPENLDAEANEEVDRIMEEITAGVLSKADIVPTSTPARKTETDTSDKVAQDQQQTEQETDEESEEIKKMQERLQSL